MERREAEAIYEQGRDAVVEVLLALSAQNERLEAQVVKLTARVAAQDERIATLERQLSRSSRNSSKPPSADRPSAPPRRGKDPSGRKQGGQPGHEGKGRPMLPAWAVDEVVAHWPTACDCGHVFLAADRVAIGEPARRQVEELPMMAVRVIEHQCQRVRCPGCGVKQTGRLPAAPAASAFGPRLQAAIVTLSVRNRISRRDVVELCEQLFSSRISTGTVDAILARTADALTEPCEDLLDRVRSARAVNMDETGWRLRGAQRAIWGMFTERHAILQITASRHDDHARELLGTSSAIVTSDRWWAYNHLPVKRRQICWSHLQRDFEFHADGRASDKEIGQAGLAVCDELFWAWEIYRHTGDRRELKRRARLLQRELKAVLRQHAHDSQERQGPVRADGARGCRSPRASESARGLDSEADLVFPGATGSFLDATALYRRFISACQRAGLPRLRFHDLRHTFGTVMAASPRVDMRRLQEWMGHVDISTTLRYAHYRPRHDDAALVTQAFLRESADSETALTT